MLDKESHLPYSYEEVYQLIKKRYPQYTDNTIVIQKYRDKPSFSFKEIIFYILKYKRLKNLSPILYRDRNNLVLNFKKIFAIKANGKSWLTLILQLVDLKFCPKCAKIYHITNFHKKQKICKQCKKQYVEAHEEELKEYRKYYKQQNKEKISQYNRQHYKDNKEKYFSRSAKRRAGKLQRLPKWVKEDELNQINQFYLNKPKGYHVDHVIPLQGKNVSGLHCLSNLQYLSAKENLSKGNKYTPKILTKGIDY